ncbi:helix-turn-helix domain-containing protein [Leptothermofonsia sp. ETS-13]|uniref:helix-turn-helix domain-containing protein n=1 Tax=Leptothermofonsia sp. ETS-13 TaxID=3035696 RepID=UPI003BA20246
MNDPILQLDREQARKLSELGDHLRQLRQHNQLSLEQVAERTMIPVRILAAIEAGNVAQLPEPVYIQGFIRRFADAIGLNGAEFASAFPTETLQETPTTSWRGTVQAQLRPLHLYLLYMVLVIGAVSGLSYLLSRSTPQMVGLTDNAQTVQPSSHTLSPTVSRASNTSTNQAQLGPFLPAASPTIQPSTNPLVAQKPVRIGLTVTAQSWIRVEVDGKTEFEGVLPEGTQRTWMANKQLTLRAGNAGGVMISFNDGTARRLGEPGAVEEVTFDTRTQANWTLGTVDSANLTASNSNPDSDDL